MQYCHLVFFQTDVNISSFIQLPHHEFEDNLFPRYSSFPKYSNTVTLFMLGYFYVHALCISINITSMYLQAE